MGKKWEVGYTWKRDRTDKNEKDKSGDKRRRDVNEEGKIGDK